MTIREQITQLFPVRRTPEQKENFRRWVQDECRKWAILSAWRK